MKLTQRLLIRLLALFWGIVGAQAQVISCKVSDEKLQPIPYVNVYNDNFEVGVITDADGIFQLDLGRLRPDDKLTFSCIGYEQQTIPAREWLPPGAACRVVLKEKVYDLAAAEIIDGQTRFRQRKTGLDIRSPLVQAGFIGDPRKRMGFEVGTMMENREVCFLEAVGLNLVYATHDTMFFEINVYDFEDATPGEPLNQRRLFLEFVEKDIKKPIELDLSAQRIRVERNFFVSVEMVRARGDERYGVLFPAKRRSTLSMAKNQRGEWEAHDMGFSIYARMKCIQP